MSGTLKGERSTRAQGALEMLETLIGSPGVSFTSDRNPSDLIAIIRSGLAESGELVPGVLSCALCAFRLVKTTLNLADGNAYANNEPDQCPNCDVPMWRVSWQQEAKEAYAVAESQMNRALEAERKLAALAADASVDDLEPIDTAPHADGGGAA